MRAVCYTRVSSDDQAESGAGLAAQLDACRRHAGRQGWDLVGPFTDQAVSGAKPLDQRPGLLDAVAELGRGDVLLVAKRDRLGRDPIAVAFIERAVQDRGARVVSAAGEGTDDDDPSSILMRRIIDAFAEYERLVIKARTRAALRAKKARGERTGTVPLGQVVNGDGRTLHPDPDEQAVLARIRGLSAAGRSPRQIAAELTRLGIRTKTGRNVWNHSSVHRILSRIENHP